MLLQEVLVLLSLARPCPVSAGPWGQAVRGSWIQPLEPCS